MNEHRLQHWRKHYADTDVEIVERKRRNLIYWAMMSTRKRDIEKHIALADTLAVIVREKLDAQRGVTN